MAESSLIDKWHLLQVALTDPALSPAAKVLMGRLLFHLNLGTGRCDPSYGTLARGAGLTRRSAMRGVQELREANWIEREHTTRGETRSHLSNSFKINFARGQQTDEVVTKRSPSGGDRTVTRVVTKRSPGVVTGLSPKQGKEEQGKGNREESLPLPPSRFDEWWLAYPRKVAKDAARKVFERVVRDRRATVDEMITATHRYAAEQAGKDPKWIKHPSTWLNGGCWADEPAPRRIATTAGPSRAGFSALAYVAGDLDDDE